MSEVFISYKQDERERMRPLAEGLRALGVEVWFDERLTPDRPFTEEINDVIQNCRAQIVCWSPAAVASEWVRGEAEIGRQRGVLVAAMIEPCTLLPPFNMYHAESIAGWSGAPGHAGWRKIADAVGRKLDRPGLGELAALQGSSDAAAWKKWAQKYSSDPQADAAWARAEDLEVGAARERLARDRDAAKRAAIAPPPIAPPPAPAPREAAPRRLPVAWIAIAGVVVAAGVAAALVLPRLIAASAPAPTVAAQAPGGSPALTPQAPPPQPAQTTTAAMQDPPSGDSETRARAALAAVNAREIEAMDIFALRALLQRVLAASSRAGLDAAAQDDARAQYLVGAAHFYNLGGGYARSDADGVAMFRKSADQGFAPAQASLGFALREGIGAPRNCPESVTYYRMSADQGDVDAQLNLGIMYKNGCEGVPENRDEAVRYLRMAARQGNAAAQNNLQYIGESW